MGAAASDARDEASGELLEETRSGVGVGGGVGAGGEAVAALAFVVAAPEEELAWMIRGRSVRQGYKMRRGVEGGGI